MEGEGGGIPACIAGDIPACLAGLQGGVASQHTLQVSRGLQAHTQGEVEGSGLGGLQAHTLREVSRPTPGGVSRPTPRGRSPGPHPGGSPGQTPSSADAFLFRLKLGSMQTFGAVYT